MNHHQQQQQSSASASTGNQFYVPRNVIESVIQNLDGLISATSVAEVLEHRRQIAKLLRFEEGGGIRNFFRLKGVLFTVKSLSKWNRVAAILKALDGKAAGKEYALRGKMAEKRILVIGGGISGLRAAIECLLIGAKGKRNYGVSSFFISNLFVYLFPPQSSAWKSATSFPATTSSTSGPM